MIIMYQLDTLYINYTNVPLLYRVLIGGGYACVGEGDTWELYTFHSILLEVKTVLLKSLLKIKKATVTRATLV